MDRREAMALQGSASYYMQRGMPGAGTGLQGSPGIHPFSNAGVPFQQNVERTSVSSTVPVEPMTSIQPHGSDTGLPSAVQPSQTVKRKRGRPRKYGPDGAVSLALTPSPSAPRPKLTPFQKRGRGRPPGTGKKQQLTYSGEWLSGSAGVGFTPHVITVAAGEDIATKITSFAQQGPKTMCVLSANGAVSTVTLRQPSISGGTVTYEGRFEILCLSGSYLPTNDGGPYGRAGGLSVSLASPDGRVIGGGVGGMLIASSPVQVIIGSFVCTKSKRKSKAKENRSNLGGSEHHQIVVDSTATPSSISTNPDMIPTSSMGGWTTSRTIDIQSPHHVDIDLMRG